MIYSIYLTATGEIVRVVDLDPADLAAAIPSGGASSMLFSDPDLQYFPSGALTDRPILTAEGSFFIDANGVDDVDIPVPSGTVIICNTISGPPIVTSGANFNFTSLMPASDEFVLSPPFPYVSATFWVYSGGVASKDYEKVKAVHVAPAAILPSKTYRPPTRNLIRDYEFLEPENFYFTHYALASGTGARTEVPLSSIDKQFNPDDAIVSMGQSDYQFELTAASMTDVLEVETDRLSPVKESNTYIASAYMSNVNGANIDEFRLEVKKFQLNSSGDIVSVGSADLIAAVVPGTAFGPQRVEAAFQVPNNVSFISLLMRSIPKATNSTNLPTVAFASAEIIEPPQRIFASSIEGEVTAVDTGSASSTTFGATTAVLLDMTMEETVRTPYAVFALCRVRNNSGSMKTLTFDLRFSSQIISPTFAVVDTLPSWDLADNEVATFTLVHLIDLTSVLPDPFYIGRYQLRATGAAAGNTVGNVRVVLDKRFA